MVPVFGSKVDLLKACYKNRKSDLYFKLELILCFFWVQGQLSMWWILLKNSLASTIWELSSPGWAILCLHSGMFKWATLRLGLIIRSFKCKKRSLPFLFQLEVLKILRKTLDHLLHNQDVAINTLNQEIWASWRDTVRNVTQLSLNFKPTTALEWLSKL